MDKTIEALDAEASALLMDSLQSPPDLLRLRLLKARTNLAKVRKSLPEELRHDAGFIQVEDQLLSTEFAISSEQTAKPQAARPETPVQEKEPQSVLSELFSLSSEGGVRQRRQPEVDKMEVSQYQQEQLSSELVEMAAAIKRNAQQFQEKLDNDGDLVATTGDAMHQTSGTMASVGSRLSQYRRESQLGWMFYIWSALFIMLSLVFGMLLIQVFGKW